MLLVITEQDGQSIMQIKEERGKGFLVAVQERPLLSKDATGRLDEIGKFLADWEASKQLPLPF